MPDGDNFHYRLPDLAAGKIRQRRHDQFTCARLGAQAATVGKFAQELYAREYFVHDAKSRIGIVLFDSPRNLLQLAARVFCPAERHGPVPSAAEATENARIHVFVLQKFTPVRLSNARANGGAKFAVFLDEIKGGAFDEEFHVCPVGWQTGPVGPPDRE